MRITRRTDYAVHLIANLAKHPGESQGLRALSDEHGVTYAFARTVQQGLLKAGIIKATRGINGGISLARPLDEISLLDVFEAAQNPLDIAFGTKDFPWCSCDDACFTTKLWESTKQSMRKAMFSVSMKELLENQTSA